MGIVFRQSVKASIVILLGAVLGGLLNYMYTRVFSLDNVGLSRNLIFQGAVLQILLPMGTGSLVFTYFKRYDHDPERQRTLLGFSFLTPLIATLLFSIPYFLLKDYVVSRYQEKDRAFISQFYVWLPVLALLWSYMTQFEHFLVAHFKVAAANFMREVLLRVLTIALMIFAWYHIISFETFVVLSVLVYAAPVAILLSLARSTGKFHLQLSRGAFSNTEYKELARFSWYHMLLGVSINLMGYVDALMITPLSPNGAGDTAVYAIAQFLISILTIPYRAMSSASFPRINEAYSKNEHDVVQNLFDRAGNNMWIVSVAMWLLVCTNLNNALALLDPSYAPIVPVVLILSLGRMIDMLTGMNTELISITRYYRFNFISSLVLLLLVLVCNRIFIPRYGVYGAAWVTSISLGVFNLAKMLYLYRIMKIHPFNYNTLKIAGAGCLIACVGFLLPRLGNPFADTAYRSLIVVSSFGLLLLWWRASPDLHQFLSSVRKNKRLF